MSDKTVGRPLALLALSLSIIAPAPLRAAPPAGEKARVVVAGALDQIGKTTGYDGAYVRLAYPGGDVPLDRGVCTDVIIRAFRKAGINLQVLVHEDMKGAFQSYPKLWRSSHPDKNIDHRRVANLMAFLRRQGKVLSISKEPGDYFPGDIVAWRLPSGLLHIGLVADKRPPAQQRYMIVHNIGAGAQLEDILFSYEIIGHYRYF